MSYKNVIKQTAIELNMPEDFVDKVYKSFWKAIKNEIQNLPLKEDLNEETYKNYRTNFNIPSIGKLNCTFKRYSKVKYIYNKLWKDTKKD